MLVPGQFLRPLINDTQCAVNHGRSRDVLLGTAAADVQTELHAAAFTMRLRISWYAACWLLAALGDMFWLGVHCFVKSQTKSSKKKNPGGKRLKFRKVPSTSWNRIKMWNGPWRQAFRQLGDLHFFCPPARHVGNMRVPGVKDLKGLGRCWRRSPAKTFVVADAKLVSCCRSYLLKRQQRNQMLHSQATIGNNDLDNGRISYQTPADIFHLADELAGGMAGGAHVTKRKRRKAARNSSLADALQGFLSQWQQAQKPPKKKGGTNAVSKDSGVISRYNNQGNSDSNGSLLTMLLTVLQNLQECSAQKSNDADVLLKIQDKLSTWKQNEQSTSTQRWQPPQTLKTANQVSRQDWQREWPELPRTKQSHQQTVPGRRANSTVRATIAGFNDTEWTMPVN